MGWDNGLRTVGWERWIEKGGFEKGELKKGKLKKGELKKGKLKKNFQWTKED